MSCWANAMKPYYDELWQHRTRAQASTYPARRRDWFHRAVLDPLIDPRANDRTEVTRAMLPTGRTLLDVGCWDGASCRAYGAFERFASVCGVDITECAVDAARHHGLEAALVDLNRDPLPFEDGRFDCVVMLAVLEHVMDPYQLLREAFRVLAAGGHLIVCVPNVASFSNRMRVLLGHPPRTSHDPGLDGGHLHYFTPRSLRELLAENGFDVIARAPTGGAPWLKRHLFPLVGEFVFCCVRRGD
jgi:methionine biosynthesis protein MetW